MYQHRKRDERHSPVSWWRDVLQSGKMIVLLSLAVAIAVTVMTRTHVPFLERFHIQQAQVIRVWGTMVAVVHDNAVVAAAKTAKVFTIGKAWLSVTYGYVAFSILFVVLLAAAIRELMHGFVEIRWAIKRSWRSWRKIACVAVIVVLTVTSLSALPWYQLSRSMIS